MKLNLDIQPLNTWFPNYSKPGLIAGPCSAESEEQLLETAKSIATFYPNAIFRAGIWKPRTRPNTFEGIGDIGLEWMKLENDRRVWFEAESHTIGRIKIPDDIFKQLQNAPLIEILGSRDYRKKRILDEYGVFLKTELAECTSKLYKRLGQLRLTEALCALEDDRLTDWLDILIDYYDKTYSFSLNERSSLQRISLKINDDMNSADIAKRIIRETSAMNKKVTV